MIRRVAFLLLAFLAGVAATLYATRWPAEERAAWAAPEARAFLREIVLLADAPMENDDCSPRADPDALRVGDYLIDAMVFLSAPHPDKKAGFVPCGERAPTMCGLSYGQSNVEGDKGWSRYLWFEVDPGTGRIDPDSFSCMGL